MMGIYTCITHEKQRVMCISVSLKMEDGPKGAFLNGRFHREHGDDQFYGLHVFVRVCLGLPYCRTTFPINA